MQLKMTRLEAVRSNFSAATALAELGARQAVIPREIQDRAESLARALREQKPYLTSACALPFQLEFYCGVIELGVARTEYALLRGGPSLSVTYRGNLWVCYLKSLVRAIAHFKRAIELIGGDPDHPPRGGVPRVHRGHYRKLWHAELMLLNGLAEAQDEGLVPKDQMQYLVGAIEARKTTSGLRDPEVSRVEGWKCEECPDAIAETHFETVGSLKDRGHETPLLYTLCELMNRDAETLFDYARSILRRRVRSVRSLEYEDLVSDVVRLTWRRLNDRPELIREDDGRSFMYRVMRYVAIDVLRRCKRGDSLMNQKSVQIRISLAAHEFLTELAEKHGRSLSVCASDVIGFFQAVSREVSTDQRLFLEGPDKQRTQLTNPLLPNAEIRNEHSGEKPG